jgi:hypothetical protein
MVAGRTVNLHPGSAIGQNARLAGNLVKTEARIEDNLTIGAATAEIGGDVGGDVTARARHVTVLPDAVVRGNLVVSAAEPPTVSPGAQIMGRVRYEDADGSSRWMTWTWFWLLAFLALLVLGLAALAFSPAWARRVADVMKIRTGSSLLAGLLVVVATPLVIALLLATVVAIPLAVVLSALYVTALLLSGVFVSYRTGQWLLERRHQQISRWAPMALGALIVSFGVTLPVVGWVVALIVLVAGTGALALERRETHGRLREIGL